MGNSSILSTMIPSSEGRSPPVSQWVEQGQGQGWSWWGHGGQWPGDVVTGWLRPWMGGGDMAHGQAWSQLQHNLGR